MKAIGVVVIQWQHQKRARNWGFFREGKTLKKSQVCTRNGCFFGEGANWGKDKIWGGAKVPLALPSAATVKLRLNLRLLFFYHDSIVRKIFQFYSKKPIWIKIKYGDITRVILWIQMKKKEDFSFRWSNLVVLLLKLLKYWFQYDKSPVCMLSRIPKM